MFDCDCDKSTGESCDSCCSTDDDCSCCPVGTVAVFNEDGSHAGCLSPNDAELFKNGVVDIPEGFVKTFDPTTGAYLGALPSAQAIEWMDFLINGTTVSGPEKTFNVVTPETAASGFVEISKPLVDGITDDVALLVDRLALTDSITVSIQNSVEDIQLYLSFFKSSNIFL